MPKALLFDADGVVIKARARYFSDRFAEKQGIPVAQVLPFFKHDMREAFVGKADITESLKNYLPQWKWAGTVDEFLAYWFGEESPRDEEVIAYVDELRMRGGYKCYLATDREQNWAEYLKENVGLKNHFDGFFFSYEVGHEKNEAEYFIEVAKELKLTPGEIMYIEDDPKNVAVAKGVGIDARLYTSLEQLKSVF